MGQKECRGLCKLLPDVIHRPWWKPRVVRYLYCPVCKVSFPDLKIYYKVDSKGRKTCICCGTTLRTVPRRSKWKNSPIYKSLEDLPKPSSGQENEELLRRVLFSQGDESDRENGDENDD